MTNINPQTRNKRISLPDRIDNFVACAVDQGYGGRDNLTRKEVYSICEVTGIVYPRWLAKNPDRRMARGVFAFPELAAAGVTTINVAPGHGTAGDDLSDMAHDDMVDVNDATVEHTDVLAHDATVTIV
jgi:hypothetical protein|tara:strand:+ start:667 stop:1050 length:384 start_codon:yes stop_codon:yes gene_type:complete